MGWDKNCSITGNSQNFSELIPIKQTLLQKNFHCWITEVGKDWQKSFGFFKRALNILIINLSSEHCTFLWLIQEEKGDIYNEKIPQISIAIWHKNDARFWLWTQKSYTLRFSFFSHHCMHMILLFWSKNWNCLLVALILLKVKFRHTQISVSN